VDVIRLFPNNILTKLLKFMSVSEGKTNFFKAEILQILLLVREIFFKLGKLIKQRASTLVILF